MSTQESPAGGPAPASHGRPPLLRRLRDFWRDLRLSRLPDRAFCRRVSLAGWDAVATARDQRRGLLIAVVPHGLPRTAARALRLFVQAQPIAGLTPEAVAKALAGGGVLYAETSVAPPSGEGWECLSAVADRAGNGARLTISKA